MTESKPSMQTQVVTTGAGICLAVVLGLAGCGKPQLTADSKCHEYLQKAGQERYDTAIRLSSELRAKDAGNPLWGPNLDYNCGQSPNQTLRSAFGK